LSIEREVKYYLSDLPLSHTKLKTAGYKFEMTKAHTPLSTVPKAIALPGVPKFVTIDGDGKHSGHIQCDLCQLDVTLTTTPHPCTFLKHHHSDACLKLQGSQGLPDPDPVLQEIPHILVTTQANSSERKSQVPCPGHSMEWLPGSLWETCPHHQHKISWMFRRASREKKTIQSGMGISQCDRRDLTLLM
jgi:hypothetical protein